MRFTVKKNKVILYITSVDISLERGPGINEREFIVGLNNLLGDKVHYLIPKPKKEIKDLSLFEENITYCHPNNFKNPCSFIQHTITQVLAYKELKRKYNFKLIVFRFDLFPLGAFIISRWEKATYYIKTLEFFDYFATQKGFKGFLGRIAYPMSGYIHKKLVSGAIAIDVCTINFIYYFKKRLKIEIDKIYYIDNTANVKRFKPIDQDIAKEKTGLKNYDRIVGFVGGRPLERGGKQLIRMAQILALKYERIGFVAVGGNENDVILLNREAERLGVSSHCTFIGAVAYEEVVNYINSFDLCVAFDLADRTELFGNASQKIRQYVACGKPVIAGKGGNEFLNTEKLGSIVDPDEMSEIIEASMQWLLLNSEEKKVHTEKAHQYACRYLSVESAIEKRTALWRKYVDLSE